jgi:hypothetical protein
VAANAEEFLLKLTQQISGPASVAAGALAKLESQIRAEEKALHGMEDSLRAAKTKLNDLQQGFGGKVDIAGIAKARAEIEKLEGKIQDGKDNLDTLAGARGGIQKAGAEADAAKQAAVQAKAREQAEKSAQAEAAAKAKIAEKASADAEKEAKATAAAKAKADAKAKSDDEKAAKANAASTMKAMAKVNSDIDKANKTSLAAKAKSVADKKRVDDKAVKDAAIAAKKAASESDLAKIGEAAKEADGPIGNIAKGFEKLKAAGPAAVLVAMVVALVAVAAAAIAGAVALTRFALASADASRSSRLLSGAAAGGSAAGAELEAVINDVANKTPLARDRIAEMGRAMELARLQGRNMQNALEAAATASSAIGDSAGAALTSIATNSQNARRFMLSRNDFTGVSAELEGTGLAFADVAASIAAAQGISVERAAQMIKAGQISVKAGLEAMNDAVQKKFGKTVAAQMLSLNTQFAKMKEGIGRLFDGVDIEPFLRGLKLITGLFSEQTVTGAALKTLFATMFNPLAAASEGIFPIISAFLRGMVIAVLTAYVAFLRVKAALNEAFGGSSASKIDWIKTAMTAGKIAVYALGVALFALVGIVALLAAVFIPLMIVLALPFILAAAAVYGLVRAFQFVTGTLNDAIIGGFQSAVAFIKGIDLAAIGTNLVTSLANAISAGASFVIDAVKNLGTSAMSALTGILGIHSPSRVFTAYGKFTAEGFADGVEEGTPAANDTVKQLGAAEPSPAPRGATGGGRSIVIENVNFTGSRADFPEFRRMFMDLIEQLNGEGPEPVT